jgi:hypothetical protein
MLPNEELHDFHSALVIKKANMRCAIKIKACKIIVGVSEGKKSLENLDMNNKIVLRWGF